MINRDPETCDDYECERGDNHTHVGVQPHLRRVVNVKGEIVDGKTGRAPVEKKV